MTIPHNVVGELSNDNKLIELSPTAYEAFLLLDWQPQEEESNVIDIPHVSQKGLTGGWSFNDCGAACIAMLANGFIGTTYTCDQVAKRVMDRHESMQVDEVKVGLHKYGLKAKYHNKIYPDAIKQLILNGKAFIALVKYRSLPKELQLIDYRWSHFIVIYGYENGFKYHDPLAREGDYRFRLSGAELEKAMYETRHDGNQPSQGISVWL